MSLDSILHLTRVKGTLLFLCVPWLSPSQRHLTCLHILAGELIVGDVHGAAVQGGACQSGWHTGG